MDEVTISRAITESFMKDFMESMEVDAAVAGAERLQFGPAIDLAFDEAHRLHRLKHAAVVEIRQPGIPAPAAAREAEFFAGLHVGRDSVLQVLRFVTGRLPGGAGADNEVASLLHSLRQVTGGRPQSGGGTAGIGV